MRTSVLRLAANLCTLGVARGLAFTPNDPGDQMWDTWLYKRPGGGWLLNYLTKHHSNRWNTVGTALSVDGAHFADAGPSIFKDCLDKQTDCAVWLGSGSVWKRLANSSNSSAEEYVMNFSQEYDCGGGNCQAIFFATSTDLVNWTPVAPDALRHGGLVFEVNTSIYHAPGRWDCIAVLPRPGGGYYGYFTATPIPAAGGPADCGGKSCGAGFAESLDGLHWTALPTPGPKLGAEVGGLCQLGGKTFMTFDGGHLFEAPGPTGPFTAVSKNYAFLVGMGPGVAFARLWGEPYTGDATLALVTHQLVCKNSIYAGLIKRAVLDDDGVLRARWWEANADLKGLPLPITVNGTRFLTPCISACLTSGLWLEGSFPAGEVRAGLWLELSDGSGVGLFLNASSDGRVTYVLGEQSAPGTWVGSPPTVIDRGVNRGAAPSTWLAVARNAWSDEGMVEFYVDGVLTQPLAIAGAVGRLAAFTGAFAAIGGANATAVHRLSLPQAMVRSA
jgi:hypothetical protein